MQLDAPAFKRRIAERLPRQRSPIDPPARPARGETEIDVSDLYSIPDNEKFLQDAYRRMLRREADLRGFVHYRELLRTNTPREVILRQIANSDEAKNLGLRYSGVRSLRGAAEGQTHRFRKLAWSTRASVQRRARQLLDVLQQRWRFDLLELKLENIHQEVVTQSVKSFAKTESVLWGISEKVDVITRAYVPIPARVDDIARRQNENADAIGRSLMALEARVLALEHSVSGKLDAITSAYVPIPARLDDIACRQGESADAIGRKLVGLETRILALQQSADAKLETISLGPGTVRAEDVVAVQVDGFILGIPAEEWRLAAYFAFRGFPDPGLMLAFRDSLRPGMVAVDVGAHIGTFTLQALRQVGRSGKVYSFEPTPRSFALLEDNVQVNGFLESGVASLQQIALSEHLGTSQFWVHPADSGHNSMFGIGDGRNQIEVRLDTLDHALHGVARVDVVKIDAEGAEPFILRGMEAVAKRSPGMVVFLEFAPVHLRRAGVEPDDALKTIRELGFRWTLVDDLTGQLRDISDQELVDTWSANLKLVSASSV